MTIEMIIEKLNTIEADASYWIDEEENVIHLTLEDFEGFTEDWEEIYREYENEEAIDAVLDWLRENADEVENDFYTCYHFGEIVVSLGYSSYDI